MSTVNERIKQLRNSLKLNQEKFAKEIGVSRAHISNIENGNDNPSSSLLKLICYKYSIDEEWLINGSGAPLPNFDTITDEGLQSKYNVMRAIFEQWLKLQSEDDLKNSVEAFSRFVSLMTSKNLTDENHTYYLENVSAIIAVLEQLIFDTYSLDNLSVKKTDYKFLLEYKEKADSKLKILDKKIKDLATIYLDEYKLGIKL